MSDQVAKSSDDPVGDFAQLAKRRRPRGSGNRAENAARLTAIGTEVAGSSFIGGNQQEPDVAVAVAATETPSSISPSVTSAEVLQAPVPAPVVPAPVTPETADSPGEAGPAEAPAASAAEEPRSQAQNAAEVGQGDGSADAAALVEDSPEPATADQAPALLVSTAPAVETPAPLSLENRSPRPSTSRQKPVRKERGADGTAPQYGENQQKVWNSFKDSRVRSRLWKQHGVNLIPEAWEALDARVKADRKSSGETELARPAYIDAVILDAPEDIDELVELVDLINEELLGVPAGDRTSVSMSPEARKKFEDLLEALGEARMKRKGKDLMTALTVRMLRKLETEGSMPRPQRRRLL